MSKNVNVVVGMILVYLFNVSVNMLCLKWLEILWLFWNLVSYNILLIIIKLYIFSLSMKKIIFILMFVKCLKCSVYRKCVLLVKVFFLVGFKFVENLFLCIW